MGDKPKPMTLKFRGQNGNKSMPGLELLLKIVEFQADELAIEGQDRNEAISTFLSPITDDSYEDLQTQLKKCKKSDKKKAVKFVATDAGGKALKSVKSAFLLFQQEERPNIKASNPEVSNTEMLSLLGASWNKLKASKKTADKKRFQKYVTLNEKLKGERVKLVASQKEKAISNCEFEEAKPKRPLSAYFIFIHSDEMKKIVEEQQISVKERSKFKSEKWKELDEAGQLPYQEKAELAKKKYESAVIEWQKRCATRKKKSEEKASNSSKPNDEGADNEDDNSDSSDEEE